MNDVDIANLVESIPDLVQGLSPDGLVSYANRAWRETLGYNETDLAGLSLQDIIAPQEIPHCMAVFDSLLEGLDEVKVRTIFLTKAGELVPVEAHVAPRWSGGQVIGSTMIARVHVDDTSEAMALSEGHGSSTEAEERLRTLIQQAPVGIAVIGSGGVVEINPALERILGYTAEDYQRQGLMAAIPEEDRGVMNAAFERLITSPAPGGEPGIADSTDIRCISKSGDEVWLRSTPSVVRDQAGRFRYVVNVLQDVTAERRMIVDLEEREQRFQSIYQESPIGITLIDEHGAITGANLAMAAMLGVDADSLVGKWFGEMRASSSPSERRNRYQDLVAGRIGSFTGSATLTAADGRDIHVESVQAAVHDKQGQFRFGIRMMTDITQRVLSEQALAENEAHLREIFEHSPLGMAVVGPDQMISDVNPEFERMVGYSKAELVGRQLNSLRPADSPPTNPGRHTMQVGGEADVVMNEHPFQRKDGSVFTGRSTWAPIRDADGRFLRSVRVIEDVTEIRQIDRIKDEFLAVVSHELRTPLSSLSGAVSLLASGALGPVSERASELLAIADRNATRLSRLINDILDLESLLAGKQAMNLAPCDAASLVDQSFETVVGVAAEAGVKLTKSGDNVPMVADTDRIVQALTNLLANAVKFSPAGSTVAVTLSSDDDCVRFAVRDEGVGVPSSLHEAIFDRFYQVASEDDRPHGGAGLGLALCKEIVSAHGGSIWVESEEGKGSTFIFELPQAARGD